MICYRTSLRRYKIAKSLGKPVDMIFDKLYKHIKTNVLDLEEYKPDKLSNSIWYMDLNEKPLMEYDIKDNTFYVDYNGIIKYFVEELNYIFDESELILKQVFDIHFGIKNVYVSSVGNWNEI